MAKKKRLNEFSILHNSKFMAVLYFLITLPFGIILGLASLVIPNDKSPFPVWLMFFLPVLYALLGFIFCALGFAVYNWVASMMSGGIEFELEEV